MATITVEIPDDEVDGVGHDVEGTAARIRVMLDGARIPGTVSIAEPTPEEEVVEEVVDDEESLD